MHGGAASHVRPGMLDLLTRPTSTPAQIITDLHVSLIQNPLAVALLGDHCGLRGARVSFVHRWFTDPDARQLHPEADHGTQSRAFAADLRAAAAGRDAKDTETSSMVGSLLGTSPNSLPGGPTTTRHSGATTANASTTPHSA
ncbi:hypothetical protein SUDANB176_00261 [Streptomyces sp. enrichment culture]